MAPPLFTPTYFLTHRALHTCSQLHLVLLNKKSAEVYVMHTHIIGEVDSKLVCVIVFGPHDVKWLVTCVVFVSAIGDISILYSLKNLDTKILTIYRMVVYSQARQPQRIICRNSRLFAQRTKFMSGRNILSTCCAHVVCVKKLNIPTFILLYK